MRWSFALAVLVAALLSAMAPQPALAKHHLVREIRSYREFQALIEHHKTKTGLLSLIHI